MACVTIFNHAVLLGQREIERRRIEEAKQSAKKLRTEGIAYTWEAGVEAEQITKTASRAALSA